MAKEKKSARTDLSGLDDSEIVTLLNTKYGENTLIVANDALGMTIEFLSTGCYDIDFATLGGIPENRVTEIRGAFSALKTTLCLGTIISFQKKRKKGFVGFIDVERSFDPVYAASLGIDLSRLVIVNPDSGEQAGDLIMDLMSTGRHTLLVIDSIAAMTPTAEIEGSLDNQFMGIHPRLINRVMRMAVTNIKRSLYDKSMPTTTVLAINQLRQKIGIMFGNPETTPGGLGKDFAYSLILRVMSSKTNAIMEERTRNGVKRSVRVAQNVRFGVLKNKVGSSQFDEGEFRFNVRKTKEHKRHTYDNFTPLLKYGLFYGLIKLKKEVKIYEGIRYKADSAFKKALMKNPDICEMLYNDILAEMYTELDTEEENEIKKTLTRKKKKQGFRKKSRKNNRG